MQTFLPYDDFVKSASVLDWRRLGKQRVETLQILNALTDPNYGWQNHPAVLMWKGSEQCLVEYGLTICSEWIDRGYNDTCYDKIDAFWRDYYHEPEWLGDERFHRAHRSVLLQKDYEYYSKYFDEPLDIEYWWPTKETDANN